MSARRNGPAPGADADAPPPPRDPQVVGRVAGLGVFLRGACVGLGLVLPLCAAALLVLGRAGVVATATPDEVARLAIVFATLPAALGGGGVGRLIWHRTAAARDAGRPAARTAHRTAALGLAALGAGVELLVAVPLGGLPEAPPTYAAILAAGAVAGALAGPPLAAWVARARRLY